MIDVLDAARGSRTTGDAIKVLVVFAVLFAFSKDAFSKCPKAMCHLGRISLS